MDSYAGNLEGLAILCEQIVHCDECDRLVLFAQKLDNLRVFDRNSSILVLEHHLMNGLAVNALGPQFLCQTTDVRVSHVLHAARTLSTLFPALARLDRL